MQIIGHKFSKPQAAYSDSISEDALEHIWHKFTDRVQQINAQKVIPAYLNEANAFLFSEIGSMSFQSKCRQTKRKPLQSDTNEGKLSQIKVFRKFNPQMTMAAMQELLICQQRDRNSPKALLRSYSQTSKAQHLQKNANCPLKTGISDDISYEQDLLRIKVTHNEQMRATSKKKFDERQRAQRFRKIELTTKAMSMKNIAFDYNGQILPDESGAEMKQVNQNTVLVRSKILGFESFEQKKKDTGLSRKIKTIQSSFLPNQYLERRKRKMNQQKLRTHNHKQFFNGNPKLTFISGFQLDNSVSQGVRIVTQEKQFFRKRDDPFSSSKRLINKNLGIPQESMNSGNLPKIGERNFRFKGRVKTEASGLTISNHLATDSTPKALDLTTKTIDQPPKAIISTPKSKARSNIDENVSKMSSPSCSRFEPNCLSKGLSLLSTVKMAKRTGNVTVTNSSLFDEIASTRPNKLE